MDLCLQCLLGPLRSSSTAAWTTDQPSIPSTLIVLQGAGRGITATMPLQRRAVMTTATQKIWTWMRHRSSRGYSCPTDMLPWRIPWDRSAAQQVLLRATTPPWVCKERPTWSSAGTTSAPAVRLRLVLRTPSRAPYTLCRDPTRTCL
jgi:hypothetical protein